MRTIERSARRLFVTVAPGEVKAAQKHILGTVWAL
jgi:hypothetical protein